MRVGARALEREDEVRAGEVAECDASFRHAERFFGGKMVCLCESWMLSPIVGAMLNERANIKRFADRFSLLSQDDSDRSAERYLFGSVRDNVSEYPQETALQRRAVAWLSGGGTLGSALGIMEYGG